MQQKFNTLQQKLASGDYPDFTIIINNLSGTPQTTSLKKLVGETQAQNKALILTFTPGPFKASDKIPDGWMQCDLAKGCTAQLAAINNLSQALVLHRIANIYAINIHDMSYQGGPEGLMKQKAANIDGMIHDPTGGFVKILGFPQITVDGSSYFERVSVVIAPNENVKIFELTSPVTLDLAKEHASAIVEYISSLKLNNSEKANHTPTPAL